MEKRKTLKNHKARGKKLVDMQKVYRALDSGRSVKSVADEWGVSPATLHRRHHEYQAELDLMFMEEDDLPPLPNDVIAPVMEKLDQQNMGKL